jgi:uncharacterized protein (TIGR02594 family)
MIIGRSKDLILVLPFESHPPEILTAIVRPQIEESDMLKGKTTPVTAFAAALLGTTYLVAASEAQAKPNHENTTQGTAYSSGKFVKKHITYKKTYTRKRKVTRRKHHRHWATHRRHKPTAAIHRRHKAPVAISRAHTRELYSTNVRQVPNARVKVVAAPAPYIPLTCGFLNLSTDCGPNTASNSSWSGGPTHMKQAESMVGMTARGNRRDLTKIFSVAFDQAVDPVRTPWCAAWANAVLAKSGVQGTNSLMARSFLGWGKSTVTPKNGDVVVLARGKGRISGHVGFFVERQEINGRRYVKVLGGNQGRSVAVAWYPESRVIGYRHAS